MEGGIMRKDIGIARIVEQLKKNKVVEAAYLFGSYARGEQTPFSDVDICVVTKKGIPLYSKYMIISGSSRKVEITAFWDMPAYIRYRVLRDGKPLFVRNKAFMDQAKIETLREYFDFRPVMERFSEEYFGDRKWIEKG